MEVYDHEPYYRELGLRAAKQLRVLTHLKCYQKEGRVPSAKNVTGGAMAREDKMTVDERLKYLKVVAPRYAKAVRTAPK